MAKRKSETAAVSTVRSFSPPTAPIVTSPAKSKASKSKDKPKKKEKREREPEPQKPKKSKKQKIVEPPPKVDSEESETEAFLDAEETTPENGYAKLDRSSLLKLLENVKSQIPAKDTHKYSTELVRLDWEKVAFDNFSANDCKHNFVRLIKQVRKFRTLSEITADAIELANNAKATFKVFADVLPPKPKGPATSFLIFAAEYREKLLKDDPSLDLVTLAKLTGERWRELAPKKKEKYVKMYEERRSVFKEEMDKYREEHPEIFQKVKRQRKEEKKESDKPKTPIALYLIDKMSRHQEANEQEQKELENSYREKWAKLSNKKKYKYIEQTMEQERVYKKKLCDEFGESSKQVSDFKTVLKKSEKEIFETVNGKPVKPPSSGFKLFVQEMAQDPRFAKLDKKAQQTELSNMYKGLSDDVKTEYNRKVKNLQSKYVEDVQEYCKKLSDSEMMNYLMNNANSINKKVLFSKLLNKEGPASKVSVFHAANFSPTSEDSSEDSD